MPSPGHPLHGILECVVNVSEGRDREVVSTLAAACGATLLDVHTDPDHHRSVLTLAGPPELVRTAARRLAEGAASLIDMRRPRGVHPCLGAIDVVPFVALDPSETALAVAAAREFAGWVGSSLQVPAFLYDAADPQGRSLPELRREAFVRREPDAGPAEPHPSMGAVAVGARRLLVAVNCILAASSSRSASDADLAIARATARDIRERDGGLPGVRALGLALTSRQRAQVSMNLVDLERTGVEAACDAVRDRVAQANTEIEAVELVGLVPRSEFERWSPAFRGWTGIGSERTIEARLAAAGVV